MIDGEEIKSWSDLWNSKYREDIMLIDGAREIIGIGLQTKGYSLNSKNDEELTEAFELLKGLAPNVKALVADEIKMYMIQEEASIAVTFSGEAADMMWENESLHYILPEKRGPIYGLIIWLFLKQLKIKKLHMLLSILC